MTNFEHMRHRLLASVEAANAVPLTESDLEREFADGFPRLMDNRLMMGRLRYGRSTSKKPLFYDLAKAELLAKQFRKTGNLELLVDAANWLRLEFRRSQHPKRHFKAVDRLA